jgi:hypothetical protein
VLDSDSIIWDLKKVRERRPREKEEVTQPVKVAVVVLE